MALTLPRFAQNARLTKASENNPPLRQGERGDGVKVLQLALIDLGYPMPGSTQSGKALPDGIFGNETASCVRGLQKSGGLAVDAVVGRQTLAELEAQTAAWNEARASEESVESRKRATSKTLNSLTERV